MRAALRAADPVLRSGPELDRHNYCIMLSSRPGCQYSEKCSHSTRASSIGEMENPTHDSPSGSVETDSRQYPKQHPFQ